jgi:hypothetical protein
LVPVDRGELIICMVPALLQILSFHVNGHKQEGCFSRQTALGQNQRSFCDHQHARQYPENRSDKQRAYREGWSMSIFSTSGLKTSRSTPHTQLPGRLVCSRPAPRVPRISEDIAHLDAAIRRCSPDPVDSLPSKGGGIPRKRALQFSSFQQ